MAVGVAVAIEQQERSLALLILVVDLGTHLEKLLNTASQYAAIAYLVYPVFDLDIKWTGAVVSKLIDWHLQLVDQVGEHQPS